MNKKLGHILLTFIAAVFAIAFLLPTLLTISNSFMSQTEFNTNYGVVFDDASGGKSFISKTVSLKFIPDMLSASQYSTVLIKSPDYLLKFWNSVWLVAPIVVFQVLIALFASYGFARTRGKLRSLIFFIYIILMLMPYQVTLVPNYLVSQWLGIKGSRAAVTLPGIFAPFSVFILTKAMRRVPVSLLEAATLDGASEFQIFRRVCLPMCRSTTYSVIILVFIDYWNMVEQPLILLDEQYFPLSIFLSQIRKEEIGLAFAVATIYMVPTLLMFLYGEEYLIEGITYSGAIKG